VLLKTELSDNITVETNDGGELIPCAYRTVDNVPSADEESLAGK
jgi:hypothetical protein